MVSVKQDPFVGKREFVPCRKENLIGRKFLVSYNCLLVCYSY